MNQEPALREEMVSILRELYEARLITPTGGNISVRLPGEEAAYLITPTQMYKGGLRPEDMVRIDREGRPAHPHQRPSVETPMHLAIYRAYPEVGAVIHTHAPLAIALGIVGGRIPPITVDAVAFTEMRIVPYALPGDAGLIRQVVEALAHSPGVLLQNHGLVTVGESLRQAANRALALEETIHILTACRILGGEMTEIPPHLVETIRTSGIV